MDVTDSPQNRPRSVTRSQSVGKVLQTATQMKRRHFDPFESEPQNEVDKLCLSTKDLKVLV